MVTAQKPEEAEVATAPDEWRSFFDDRLRYIWQEESPSEHTLDLFRTLLNEVVWSDSEERIVALDQSLAALAAIARAVSQDRAGEKATVSDTALPQRRVWTAARRGEPRTRSGHRFWTAWRRVLSGPGISWRRSWDSDTYELPVRRLGEDEILDLAALAAAGWRVDVSTENNGGDGMRVHFANCLEGQIAELERRLEWMKSRRDASDSSR